MREGLLDEVQPSQGIFLEVRLTEMLYRCYYKEHPWTLKVKSLL
jgi:hypothetical protein